MPSSIPQLKTCCCCLKTETGAIIIGWLETISCIIGSLIVIFSLVINIQYLHNPAQVTVKGTDGIYRNFTIREASEVQDVVISATALVYFVIAAISGIVLLIGVSKRNMGYVKIWMIVSVVYLIISLALISISITLLIAGKNSGNIIQLTISFVCSIYYLLVVYSYYRENKSGATRVL